MRVFLLLLFYLLLPLLSCSIAAEPITFLTHPLRPLTYSEDGVLKGVSVELVREMMKIEGTEQPIVMYPFKRALKTVFERPHHALFIVAKRPEREEKVKWVGPIITSSVYFYKRKGSAVSAKTLGDLKNSGIIGVGLGNADHVMLQKMGLTNLYPTVTQEQSISMLKHGRVALTPVSELVFPELVRQCGASMDDFEKTDLKLYESVLYLVFSKDTKDETVARWQHALDELRANGVYTALHGKYFNTPLH